MTESALVVAGLGGLLGLLVGSFLNVVIYRVPRNMSLSNPRQSFCPACKHPLGIPDLFPLLSWLVLRGKCRHCGAKVASRYFWVEVLNGSIWAGIWYQYFVVEADPARAIAYALAASTLVAIIFIDWELYIIPDQINAFLFAVGWGLNIWLLIKNRPDAWTWGIPSSLAGWVTGVGVLWGIALLGRLMFRKNAMGHGDIKMARGIGAVLFPATALMSFALAVFMGAIIGGVFVLYRARKGTLSSSDEEVELVVPKDSPAEVLELVQAHRRADKDEVKALARALVLAWREAASSGENRSPKNRQQFLAVAAKLEQSPGAWLLLSEDDDEANISERFMRRHECELEKIHEHIVARQWDEARASIDRLLEGDPDSITREGLKKAKDRLARRGRFYFNPVESVGSLFKSGFGYLFCIDIVGLFVPKLYESWFGEPAYEPFEEVEDYPIERTMIPFGPYLALGAIAATVFQADLRRGVDAYVRWVAGPPPGLEQSGEGKGQ